VETYGRRKSVLRAKAFLGAKLTHAMTDPPAKLDRIHAANNIGTVAASRDSIDIDSIDVAQYACDSLRRDERRLVTTAIPPAGMESWTAAQANRLMGRSTYMDPRALIQAMHEHGWNQAELARRAEVSETAVSRAVRGFRIDWRNANRIIQTLDGYPPLPESQMRMLKRVS
jgi:hypothetical protein